MKDATQLTIVLPNVPSALAQVCDALRASSVNIEAMFCTEGRENTHVHLVVDDPETAKMVLRSFSAVTETSLIELSLKNQLGAIGSVARKCAGSGINIRYIFAISHGKLATVFLATNDMKKAMRILVS